MSELFQIRVGSRFPTHPVTSCRLDMSAMRLPRTRQITIVQRPKIPLTESRRHRAVCLCRYRTTSSASPTVWSLRWGRRMKKVCCQQRSMSWAWAVHLLFHHRRFMFQRFRHLQRFFISLRSALWSSSAVVLFIFIFSIYLSVCLLYLFYFIFFVIFNCMNNEIRKPAQYKLYKRIWYRRLKAVTESAHNCWELR